MYCTDLLRDESHQINQQLNIRNQKQIVAFNVKSTIRKRVICICYNISKLQSERYFSRSYDTII